MAEVVNDIKPTRTDSAYISAPFDIGKAELEARGYHLISAEENAGLRIQHGKDAFVSKNGNYVIEGSLFVPGKGRFMIRDSLVVAYPKEATQAHSDGKEFYISNEEAEEALTKSVIVPYNQSSVPCNRFGEDPATVFLFGQIAQKYGDFLKEAGITAMPLRFNGKDYIDSNEKPFANQLWLAGLDDGSAVDGYYRDLDYSYTLRGVRFNAEGVAQKISEGTYSLSQILEKLRVGNLGGLESTITKLFQSKN